MKLGLVYFLTALFTLRVRTQETNAPAGSSGEPEAPLSPTEGVVDGPASPDPSQQASPPPGPTSSSSEDAKISSIQAPPLGPFSAKMEKWTADSVLSTVGQNSEATAGDRFALQKALIASAPEKNASLAGLQSSADSVKKGILKFSNRLVNVTTILNADASAGGLIAVSRSLMNQMPATQALLTKAMDAQAKNLKQNSAAMKQAIEGSEDTYATEMRALADTVTSLIVQQDAAYARQAASQARAMNKTTQAVGQQATKLNDASSARARSRTTPPSPLTRSIDKSK